MHLFVSFLWDAGFYSSLDVLSFREVVAALTRLKQDRKKTSSEEAFIRAQINLLLIWITPSQSCNNKSKPLAKTMFYDLELFFGSTFITMIRIPNSRMAEVSATGASWMLCSNSMLPMSHPLHLWRKRRSKVYRILAHRDKIIKRFTPAQKTLQYIILEPYGYCINKDCYSQIISMGGFTIIYS